MSHSPLGSLSSPSPSPPPNPVDESELSELTDDDDRPPPPSQRRRQPPPSAKRKKRGGLVPAPMWDWAYKNDLSATPCPSDPKQKSQEEEEEELPTPPLAMEEEEAEDPDLLKDDRKHSRHESTSRRRKKVVVPMPLDLSKFPRSKRGTRPILARTSKWANEALLKRLWERGVKFYDPNAPTSDEDDPSPSSSTSDDDQDDMLVDRTPFLPPPAVDIPSVPPSIRASPDPTISPPDDDDPPPPIPDHDPPSPDHPPPDPDLEQDPDDDDDDPQPDEPSQPPSPTPLLDPEPEPDHEDDDPDLQPAHRAEALDVLATIELRFALLREKLYVEKMHGLAWEEALVCDGAHPELHHLHSELSKRRDKRLLLASNKRSHELEALARKRREQESWHWDTWDIARTDLQTDMIAETNRKRRKLERERRSVERPPGVRHIPPPILNPPPAPTLRQIAKTFPLPSHLSHLAANKKRSDPKGLGVHPALDGLSAYPDLASLSPHDIAADLEFLFQHRRLGYGFGMPFPPIGVPMSVGLGYNSTTPAFGPPSIGFAAPTPVTNGSQIGGPLGGSGPPPSSAPTPNPNTDGSSFSQPAMGVFQGPPSVGAGPPGYPMGSGTSGTSIVIGPGGTTSTPVIGPGGPRIQRPSGFVEREREREMIQRERELAPRNRDLPPLRETEMREREFGPSIGPGYPAWNSKPPPGMDWTAGDARRREERERIERNERGSQIQPIVPTPSHRHLHQHALPHAHTHQLQQHPVQSPHQPHPVHAHQSHLNPHPHPHRQQHPHQHTQHQHASSHAPPHHHLGQHHHHRHHHHVVHHHHPASGSGSADGASPLPQGPGVQTIEIINLSANSPSQSPPRVPPTTSPSTCALNAPLPLSTGPFPLQRKPSPVLPKLGMSPLGYSPRLAGPGVVPPTGPGVTPSGILTSGPGVPPGPGIAPAPAPPGENGMFGTRRTTSPMMPYAGPVASMQKVSVDGM